MTSSGKANRHGGLYCCSGPCSNLSVVILWNCSRSIQEILFAELQNFPIRWYWSFETTTLWLPFVLCSTWWKQRFDFDGEVSFVVYHILGLPFWRKNFKWSIETPMNSMRTPVFLILRCGQWRRSCIAACWLPTQGICRLISLQTFVPSVRLFIYRNCCILSWWLPLSLSYMFGCVLV